MPIAPRDDCWAETERESLSGRFPKNQRSPDHAPLGGVIRSHLGRATGTSPRAVPLRWMIPDGSRRAASVKHRTACAVTLMWRCRTACAVPLRWRHRTACAVPLRWPRRAVPGIRDSIFDEEQQKGGSAVVRGTCGQSGALGKVSTNEAFRKVCQIGNHFQVRDYFARESREWARMSEIRMCLMLCNDVSSTIAIASGLAQQLTCSARPDLKKGM